MKKINYRVADAVFLIIVLMGLKAFDRYIIETLKYNKNSIFMAISVSLVFLGIYINRYFFRPSYKEITQLKRRGWKITGYYSSLSLSNEDIYNKSYDLWIKYSCLLLLTQLFGLLVLYVLNGCFLTNSMFFAHIAMACISQVAAWIITLRREKKYWKNKQWISGLYFQDWFSLWTFKLVVEWIIIVNSNLLHQWWHKLLNWNF